MRTAHKVWSGVAAGVFGLVALGDLSGATTAPVPTTSTAPLAAPAAAPVAVAAPASAPVAAPAAVAPVAAAPVRPAAPLTVTSVSSPADLGLSDGRHVHVAAMNGVLPWKGEYTRSCERTADQRLARQMLLNEAVSVTAPPHLPDVADVVPAGAVQVDLTVGGADYADTFAARAYDARDAACPTETPAPAPATSGTSTSDTDVHVHLGHDDGLPDGALTGGFCRKKWWC